MGLGPVAEFLIDHRRIVLLGRSVYLMAVEAGLVSLPGKHVERVSPHDPTAIERILALDP